MRYAQENIMYRLIALSALALVTVSPVLAQETAPDPVVPALPEVPQAPTPPDSIPLPVPDAVPPSAAPAAPPRDDTAAKEAAIKDVVDTEFPVYDVNKNAKLNKIEFIKWASALREKSEIKLGKTEPLPPAEMTLWANAAFVEADQDKNKAVTKDEMMLFLMG
jgi:hypothetical protein